MSMSNLSADDMPCRSSPWEIYAKHVKAWLAHLYNVMHVSLWFSYSITCQFSAFSVTLLMFIKHRVLGVNRLKPNLVRCKAIAATRTAFHLICMNCSINLVPSRKTAKDVAVYHVRTTSINVVVVKCRRRSIALLYWHAGTESYQYENTLIFN